MSKFSVSSNEYPSILPSVNSKNNGTTLCKHCRCSPHYSSSESSSQYPCPPPAQEVQEIDYEKFKTILQQSSSRSGNNLFNHLVEIIKRIIDERPVNVIDYFEQFSRNIRKTKLSSAIESVEEPQFLELAKSFIEFLMPTDVYEKFSYIDEFEGFGESEMTIYQSSDSIHGKIQRNFLENENILQIQHLFGHCGLGFNIDEVFQLSLSVQKVQLHQHVENARFWGRILGLHGSYYIVEADITPTETENRFKSMETSLLDDMKLFISKKERYENSNSSNIQFIPGSKWQSFPEEDLKKMQQPTEPVPKLQFDEIFHSPEEPVGTGLNRKTYFVTTSLSEEWQELPTVAPRHIRASKRIKKYFTGDLNVDLRPLFPGSEKHYLRAMIARISSGSFIAPKGFYRRMTRKERNLTKENENPVKQEMKPDEEDDLDNDALITQNNGYRQLSVEELLLTSNWEHIRPNILSQGRVLHVNENLAIQNLEKKAILSMKSRDLISDTDDAGEDEFEGEEDLFQQEDLPQQEECPQLEEFLQQEKLLQQEELVEENLPETGPDLFSSCSKDKNNEEISSWTSRYSSVYNNTNQMVMMRSNLWPGAYSIGFENFSDYIYLGWGFKYVARCTSLEELPVVQDIDYPDIAKEITDPTVEMEEKWRRYHMKKAITLKNDEEMSEFSVEVDSIDED